MEYLFIFIFQLIGFCIHCYTKIGELDKKHTDVPKSKIVEIFFSTEWLSFFAALVVLAFQLALHLLIDYTWPALEDKTFGYGDFQVPFMFLSGMLAFFLGWNGQNTLYKVLGKADDKITALINKQ
ncbi:MAG TPA: hypothetical protein VL728_19540 [Cyclobacteriaceae bacterium]|jgi:hypothetical protein|nr:hypothetical protein [Cyclobacteriaceae bacterium]